MFRSRRRSILLLHICSFAFRLMYRRSTVIIIWSLLLAGAAYLFVFEPGKSGFFLACPFRLLTGFTCPGCGTTRAMHEILHGHFAAAFMLNPLLLLAIPFPVVCVASLQRDRDARWRAAPECSAGACYLWSVCDHRLVLDLS